MDARIATRRKGRPIPDEHRPELVERERFAVTTNAFLLKQDWTAVLQAQRNRDYGHTWRGNDCQDTSDDDVQESLHDAAL